MKLRMSSLSGLSRCPGFMLLQSADEGPGGKAAQTGSAVGRVIQLWHELGESPVALAAAMRQALAESAAWPDADWDDVALWANGYAHDRRNWSCVLPNSCELEVKLTLGGFELVGHVDQIRRVSGGLQLWDVKSGKPAGREMGFSYAWQIAAYSLAATETLGETVLPGGIIRVRSYAWNNRCKWDREDMSTCPAFFYTPWSLDVCREMMATVESHLSMLAEGKVHLHPGVHCAFCPGQGPHLCGDKLEETFR